jgi:uncharacterized damage-inducible protein DinB
MEYLRELMGHQAWADAELWRAIEAHPAACTDRVLLDRAHHIHLVQHAFLSIVGHEPFSATQPADFATIAALKAYGRDANARAAAFVAAASAECLGERLVIPWFKDPPIEITVAQALMQAAMHSHSHRGQNATRLRELGGEPPLMDLIVWYWKQRPEARWE